MSLRLSLSFALNSERSGRKRTKTRTLLPFLNGAITNRSNDGTHRRIQRWKDIMAACFKSGAKDATGTKVANQTLSSIPRGLGNTGRPEKNAVVDDELGYRTVLPCIRTLQFNIAITVLCWSQEL